MVHAECVACAGGALPCKGGGNIHCGKRDPKPARLALILDIYGGVRTIVGSLRSIRANTLPGEICHVVPRLILHEPIAWNDIPIVIARSRIEFEKWLDTRPNLPEQEELAVKLYKLRKLRLRQATVHLPDIVET